MYYFSAIVCSMLHREHLYSLFEGDKHFSHLSNMEREMAFRTEMVSLNSYSVWMCFLCDSFSRVRLHLLLKLKWYSIYMYSLRFILFSGSVLFILQNYCKCRNFLGRNAPDHSGQCDRVPWHHQHPKTLQSLSWGIEFDTIVHWMTVLCLHWSIIAYHRQLAG